MPRNGKKIIFGVCLVGVVFFILNSDNKNSKLQVKSDKVKKVSSIFANDLKNLKNQIKAQKQKTIQQNPSIKLPPDLAKKVLLTEKEKKLVRRHFTNQAKVKAAIGFLLDTTSLPVGKVGINRIDSIDYIERALSLRMNQSRSRIVNFIEKFVHQEFQLNNKKAKKFFVGDQIELLEILAFNQPQEFHYLKQRTTSKKVLKMMSLVEHHANRNL